MNPFARSIASVAAAFGLLGLAGCDQSPAPQFHLNRVELVTQLLTNETSEPYEQEIANVLAAMFGTPDAPFAMPETGLNQTKLELAAGSAWSDSGGVERGLYRKHCVHCHGVTGDGRGPTARFLNPYPRDYRQGVFKFKSTRLTAKPTDADLHRVLHNGVPGTSMPSFALLPRSEVEALIEYVKYLSIRGEMESRLIRFVAEELGEDDVEDEQGNVTTKRLPLDPASDPDQAEAIKEFLTDILAAWEEASDQVVTPEDEQIPTDERSADEIAQSIARGKELFYGTKGNCFSCHGPTALGDGQQTDFDVWNKQQHDFIVKTNEIADAIADATKKVASGEELDEDQQRKLEQNREELEARQRVVESFYPTRNAIPRNLRKGIYRGGRRPIDIFHRVYNGIAGSPMPGLGPAEGAEANLSEEELWSIVDYVLSLPYEAISGPQPALHGTNVDAIVN